MKRHTKPSLRTRVLVPALLAAGLGASTAAIAGEQYVDATGYAVSGYDVVAYHDLAASGGSSAPVAGSADITATWNGAVWAFAREANRQRFLADPAAFAPAYDGHCAYGVAQGNKVPGSPALWHLVDGRLYLNFSKSVDASWLDDVEGYVADAESNWDWLEADAASAAPVPDFDTSAAPRR